MNFLIKMEQKGFTIKLPEDKELVGKLKRKRSEYAGRLEQINSYIPIKNEKQSRMFYNDSKDYYKLAILSEVLDFGKIEMSNLSLEIFNEEKELFGKEIFNLESFNNACEIINDYCVTGGKNVFGGTGLK